MNLKLSSFIALALGFVPLAYAGGSVDENLFEEKPLSVEKLRERFRLRGEIFVMDAAGKRVLNQGSEARSWSTKDKNGRLEINWGSGSNIYKAIELQSVWTLRDDGTLHAVIEQFERKDGGPGRKSTLGKSLRKQEFDIENFAPIVWKSAAETDRNVVVRLTPELTFEDDIAPISEVLIGGKEMLVVDNLGNLWTDHVTVSAKYVAMTTFRGRLALSYYPFPGAKELGFVSGRRMELRLPDQRVVSLVSEEPFLPGSVRATVYGFFDPAKKTGSIKSLGLSTTGKENRFLESLKN